MANNARNNVRQAAAKAQANKQAPAVDLSKLTPEQLAQLQAMLAGGQAPAKQDKADDKPAVDATKFIGKLVKVTGGRKQKDFEGITFKAYHATKGNAYRKPSILAEGQTELKAGDTPSFLNPAYLEIVGDMTKADFDRLSAMQKAQSDETLYVTAFLRNDKSDTENAIRLSNKGWAKDVWFAKAKGDTAGMISLTGEETPDGEKIFEVAAWKVRKELGMDTYNAIKAQQAALAAIVERKA